MLLPSSIVAFCLVLELLNGVFHNCLFIIFIFNQFISLFIYS